VWLSISSLVAKFPFVAEFLCGDRVSEFEVEFWLEETIFFSVGQHRPLMG
jgi:hypothetical protein